MIPFQHLHCFVEFNHIGSASEASEVCPAIQVWCSPSLYFWDAMQRSRLGRQLEMSHVMVVGQKVHRLQPVGLSGLLREIGPWVGNGWQESVWKLKGADEGCWAILGYRAWVCQRNWLICIACAKGPCEAWVRQNESAACFYWVLVSVTGVLKLLSPWQVSVGALLQHQARRVVKDDVYAAMLQIIGEEFADLAPCWACD